MAFFNFILSLLRVSRHVRPKAVVVGSSEIQSNEPMVTESQESVAVESDGSMDFKSDGPIVLESDESIPFESDGSIVVESHGPVALESDVQLRPAALESSTLGKLCLELILHIASFLPPGSASSFTLCCRPIYFMLGNQFLKSLNGTESSERFNFLTLLERDLPYHIACYNCTKLHAINERDYSNIDCFLRRPRPADVPIHVAADHSASVHLYIHPRFCFTAFQMAMKLHRQGADCSKLLDLLSLKTVTGPYFDYVRQRTALALIVTDSLFVRQQTILRMPPTTVFLSRPDPMVLVCPHVHFTFTKRFSRNWAIAQSSGYEPEGHRHTKGIERCRECLTEFRIDLKSFEGHGDAVFVTKWQDLGEGRSFLDLKWLSHTRRRIYRGWRPIKRDLGSICAAFEQKDYLQFDFASLLTPKNEKELFGSRTQMTDYY